MQRINCDGCGRLTPSYEIVSYGSMDREYRQLCSRLLVIDGREITWEKFGRMLMTFEGWQFKLEIRDMSEELYSRQTEALLNGAHGMESRDEGD